MFKDSKELHFALQSYKHNCVLGLPSFQTSLRALVGNILSGHYLVQHSMTEIKHCHLLLWLPVSSSPIHLSKQLDFFRFFSQESLGCLPFSYLKLYVVSEASIPVYNYPNYLVYSLLCIQTFCLLISIYRANLFIQLRNYLCTKYLDTSQR